MNTLFEEVLDELLIIYMDIICLLSDYLLSDKFCN